MYSRLTLRILDKRIHNEYYAVRNAEIRNISVLIFILVSILYLAVSIYRTYCVSTLPANHPHFSLESIWLERLAFLAAQGLILLLSFKGRSWSYTYLVHGPLLVLITYLNLFWPTQMSYIGLGMDYRIM